MVFLNTTMTSCRMQALLFCTSEAQMTGHLATIADTAEPADRHFNTLTNAHCRYGNLEVMLLFRHTGTVDFASDGGLMSLGARDAGSCQKVQQGPMYFVTAVPFDTWFSCGRLRKCV
jgi:hypothetical protein